MEKYYKKAVQNLIVAKIAEKKGFYEIALSRYYYNIYLIVCGYLLSENNKYEFKQGKGSHYNTITDFIKKISLKNEDKRNIKNINKLLTLRNNYEYNGFF